MINVDFRISLLSTFCSNFFELMRFDFVLDAHMNVWLMEVSFFDFLLRISSFESKPQNLVLVSLVDIFSRFYLSSVCV